ncbi:MAG: hypothetical protein CMP47_11545 [Rickettsiales bacterium]|nr:hypothetical protein [Rickettsiales bacterium]
MDWLTFFSKMIESLAWPVGAVVIVAILKDELKKLLPFLKKFKAGPLEAEFERDVEKLKRTSQNIEEDLASNTNSKDFLLELVEIHPRSAILEAWVRLEAAARLVLSKQTDQYSKSNYQPASKLARALESAGLISSAQVTTYEDLRRLRNEVAHNMDLEPNFEAAKTYIELASYLQAYLETEATK